MNITKESVDLVKSINDILQTTPTEELEGNPLFTSLKDMYLKSIGKRDCDYLTADKSAKYLGVSRGTFYETIVPKYKLVNHKFNTVPIGYYIPDLDEVKKKME